MKQLILTWKNVILACSNTLLYSADLLCTEYTQSVQKIAYFYKIKETSSVYSRKADAVSIMVDFVVPNWPIFMS